MRLFNFFRSLKAGMRASRILGRGFRLRDRGDFQGALTQAQMGLSVLGQPFVRRNHPVEGSCLIGLTILAEQAAVELHVQGASMTDLADSIALLKELPDEKGKGFHCDLPFLEERLAVAQRLPG